MYDADIGDSDGTPDMKRCRTRGRRQLRMRLFGVLGVIDTIDDFGRDGSSGTRDRVDLSLRRESGLSCSKGLLGAANVLSRDRLGIVKGPCFFHFSLANRNDLRQLP